MTKICQVKSITMSARFSLMKFVRLFWTERFQKLSMKQIWEIYKEENPQ